MKCISARKVSLFAGMDVSASFQSHNITHSVNASVNVLGESHPLTIQRKQQLAEWDNQSLWQDEIISNDESLSNAESEGDTDGYTCKNDSSYDEDGGVLV